MDTFIKLLKVICMALLAALLLLAIVGGFWLLFLPRVANSHSSPTVSYAEMVSIVLTALTAMLGIGAIFVSVLAIWGYSGLRGEAIRIASEGVRETIESKIDRKHVHEQVSKTVREIILRDATVYASAFDTPNMQEQTNGKEKLGVDYPGEKP